MHSTQCIACIPLLLALAACAEAPSDAAEGDATASGTANSLHAGMASGAAGANAAASGAAADDAAAGSGAGSSASAGNASASGAGSVDTAGTSTLAGSTGAMSAGSTNAAGGLDAGGAQGQGGSAGEPPQSAGDTGLAGSGGAMTAAAGATDVAGNSGGDDESAGAEGMAGASADTAGASGQGEDVDPSDPVVPSVLLFSKTEEYRHESIEFGTQALAALASERGWQLVSTEDAANFSDGGLAGFNVLLFLSTTGDVLSEPQQAAMERFIQAGNGFVGVHAASDTEYDWPWYGALVGAYFRAHPAIQNARITIEDATHTSTSHLAATWERTDEWYGFVESPRGAVNVLMTLDETSYAAGDSSMDGDHPIAWYHEYDGGRAFYTALGHTQESYEEQAFIDHIAGAILWAAGAP